MQVQSSYSSSYYSAANKTGKSDSATLGNSTKSTSKSDLQQMLDNLREDPSAVDRISEKDDGTYAFDMRAGGWSDKAFAAYAIVTELNGGSLSSSGAGGQILPSEADAQLFKKMSGYNLLVLGGTQVVLDDEGFPPAASDQKSVQQAFDLVNDAACFRAAGYLEGDLTSENVSGFLTAFNIAPGSSNVVDQLLEALKKPDASSPAETPPAQQSQVDTLMTMITA